MKLKYLPCLDGIRACAIGMVFVSHAGLDKLVPGGLGVTVFFFLSGYLITSLLRAEWANTGTISLRGFYTRRAFRILPPLYLVMALFWLSDLFLRSQNHATGPGVASLLFYFYNYASVFHIAPTQTPTGLGVAWSLMVEEHFYLVFPCLYLIFRRSAMSVRSMVSILLLGCSVALFWRAVMVFQLHTPLLIDKPWTYVATDCRFDGILWGCILAIAANPWCGDVRPFLTRHKGSLASIGFVLMTATLLFRAPEFRQTLRYTLQAIALLPIFYYVVETPADAWQTRWLSWQPVRWVGWVSYTIYLVHFGILEKLRLYVHWPRWALAVVTALLSGLFAELVRRLIDVPLQNRNRARRRLVSLPLTIPRALTSIR